MTFWIGLIVGVVLTLVLQPAERSVMYALYAIGAILALALVMAVIGAYLRAEKP